MHREGAKIALSYAGEKMEKRVKPLAEELGIDFVESCDVTNDDELDTIFNQAGRYFGGKLDIVIHSVAYAPQEDLGGRYSDMSRAGFHLTLDISAYSLIAMAKRARPLMTDGGTILAMTFYAAEKVMPRYNAMSVAKAALESSIRYLAADLGQEKIRVNGISAGAIKTLAAAGIPGFRQLLNGSEKVAPLKRLVSQGDVGNAAVFLASDWGQNITGEVMHVDAGYNILGYLDMEEEETSAEA
jgi:enoyl-[acyl-carrier protein] reductase I